MSAPKSRFISPDDDDGDDDDENERGEMVAAHFDGLANDRKIRVEIMT